MCASLQERAYNAFRLPAQQKDHPRELEADRAHEERPRGSLQLAALGDAVSKTERRRAPFGVAGKGQCKAPYVTTRSWREVG